MLVDFGPTNNRGVSPVALTGAAPAVGSFGPTVARRERISIRVASAFVSQRGINGLLRLKPSRKVETTNRGDPTFSGPKPLAINP